MYNHELERDRVTPSFQKLIRMGRQDIDQTIRTRNFKAQNERISTGVRVKSRTGRNVSAERKVGKYFQWKTNGQCSRGDSYSFFPRVSSWSTGTIVLFCFKSADTDWRKKSLTNMAIWEEKVLQDSTAKDRVKMSLQERAQIRRV